MRHIGFIVFCAASLAMQDLAAITATKEYVDRKDAQTYTNAIESANAYTDQKVAAAEPGNYAVVSNRAMSALQSEYVWYDEDDGTTRTNSFVFERYGFSYKLPGWTPGIESYLRYHGEEGLSMSSADSQFDISLFPSDAEQIMWGTKNGEWYYLSLPARDGTLALSEDIDGVSSRLKDNVEKTNGLADDVSAIRSVMAGEDFRITVTNYDSKVHAPKLSMEARYSDGTTQTWNTVWTETNGLARTKLETLAEVKSNYYGKAESDSRYKAWCKYDSETGEDAPKGFTQVSSPGGLIIGADAGWKNYISASGGSYWILRGNGNITTSQETGALEIIDADGNAVFTVVKCDKTLESAAAASISSTGDGVSDIVTIVYNVEADEAPVIEWSAELKPAAWYKQTDDGFPGTVKWASENNTKWTATVTLPANGRGFFRATYYKGADSYIKATKAMAIEKITVGGKTYTLGVGEINGTKVLTLK